MGLFPGQVTVIIHTGSRGFGYQICDDYLAVMDRALAKYHIRLPDRQLACAPLRSPEGQQYLAAMRCGINFAFANRQIIAHNTRKAFAEALGMREEDIGLRTVYEVAHNIAKIEEHTIDGERRHVCVHRKGATRAFPPGHPQIPAAYRSIGQPVLIPGDMGRYSYVLVGTEQAMQETFGSTCHGAGRQLSRTKAKKVAGGRRVADELRARGIIVRGASIRTINEEIPEPIKTWPRWSRCAIGRVFPARWRSSGRSAASRDKSRKGIPVRDPLSRAPSSRLPARDGSITPLALHGNKEYASL